jgi:hypothetical protein
MKQYRQMKWASTFIKDGTPRNEKSYYKDLQIHFQYTTPHETTQGNEISFALIKND